MLLDSTTLAGLERRTYALSYAARCTRSPHTSSLSANVTAWFEY